MIKNTFDWYNGEIFEAKFILGFGLFLIAIAFLFYLYGNLPSAKVLLFPLLVIGIFFTAIGVGSIYSNSKRAIINCFGFYLAEFNRGKEL